MQRERGLSNSIQFALLFPLVLLLFFIALQWSMYAWASAVALSAAQDGAREAASHSATAASGQVVAQQAINPDILRDALVEVDRGEITTTVTVTGRALAIFGVPALPVTKIATVPTERLTR